MTSDRAAFDQDRRAHEMLRQLGFLRPSQRASLRRYWKSALDAVTVTQRGWKTRVVFDSLGTRHQIDLGPRGKVLARDVADVRHYPMAFT